MNLLLSKQSTTRLYVVWILFIGVFALLHALNLRADFPHHSPWGFDGAIYTDEGWYANAAVRENLYGHWYLPGDFNPAPAVPLWPLLEWALFTFTGVSIQSARGLAIAFFFANLVLSYFLLRERSPVWVALLGLTFLVTSPFLFCFSRLAILEPLFLTLTLTSLNLAIRLPRLQHPVRRAALIGLLFALMTLTKTTAIFLLPALAWAIFLPLRKSLDTCLRCALAATATSVVTLGLWIALIVKSHMTHDFESYFSSNGIAPPVWSFLQFHHFLGILHTGWMTDGVLIPLAALMTLGTLWKWQSAWSRQLRSDPIFGTSVWAVAGYVLFMVYHDYHPPRYFAIIAVFGFLLLAKGAGALFSYWLRAQEHNWHDTSIEPTYSKFTELASLGMMTSAVTVLALSLVMNGVRIIKYAANPEYTFVNAAQELTRYIDDHPNGKRILVSVSGDQIALVTHLASLCSPAALGPCSTFPTPAEHLASLQPGWYAEWNTVNSRTLAILHTHFSVEQVASFRAFDLPEHNVLVLFKLHMRPAGQVRDSASEALQVSLADDKIDIPIL